MYMSLTYESNLSLSEILFCRIYCGDFLFSNLSKFRQGRGAHLYVVVVLTSVKDER